MAQGKKGTGLSGTYQGTPCREGHTMRYKNGSACVYCTSIKSRTNWKNSAEFREQKRRQRNTPQGKKLAREAQYKRLYGISLAEYDRMEEEQIFGCAICGGLPTGSSGKFHVDHNHITGEVRALLCQKCNIGIGVFDEDENKLRLAIAYLARY